MTLNLFEQQQANLMRSIEQECAVDAKKPLAYPPVAISYGEMLIKSKQGDNLYPIPLGTYGNFSVIQAPPKTKKTFFISLMTSVYLSGSNIYGQNIKGHRADKNVIHIDTEQGHWHSQRVFQRVLNMNKEDYSENYYTFALRTVGFKDRISFIEYCLKTKIKNTGLLIIDGIADLVSDVNNIEESNLCVQKLMEWSGKYNLHIMTVIHSNFGNDKPTGHLGSFLEKKTETQIQLEQNTANEDWITVKCKRSRGYPFETFSFKVNEYGLPTIVNNVYSLLNGFYTKDKTNS